jgi:hypothetical protein
LKEVTNVGKKRKMRRKGCGRVEHKFIKGRKDLDVYDDEGQEGK